MEVVLNMKLTDLAIIAQVFFICILVVVHVKGDIVHNRMTQKVMYNNVMDNITEDSLAIGFVGVDAKGVPKVILDDISSYYKKQAKLYGETPKHILFYVDYDGVTFCLSQEEYKWNDKIYFTNNGDILHENKVAELIDIVKSKYGIDMSISYNDGEKWSNSIDDYMLCSISYHSEQHIYCFSGAKIHKKAS